jgi:hypothetical protein
MGEEKSVILALHCIALHLSRGGNRRSRRRKHE